LDKNDVKVGIDFENRIDDKVIFLDVFGKKF